MLTKDTLYTGEEAREKLMNGIRKSAAAVGITMGTGGRNSLIEDMRNPGYLTTNDGYTILNSIRFKDEIEDLGRKILVEAVNRANKQSGDGSSTTTVLTAAILEEGNKHLTGTNAMELKREMDACISLIEEAINAQKRDITVDEVAAVAAISAEDTQIGATIAEIYKQIGKEGIIYWDVSKTSEDSYTVGTGITVEGAGYFSPYMCDATESGQSTNQIRIKNPHILLTTQKITTAAEFESIAIALNQKQVKDLVVFCDEIEPLIIGDLLLTRAKQGFRIVLVKMPVLWKDQWFMDLAKASGATIIDPVAGLSLAKATGEHIGTFSNIVITKDDTFIDGIKDITDHLKTLEEDGSEDAQNRIARLNTKTARYFVGAHSESALSYRRLKVEDAISAAYQALNGGIVVGGGLALAGITTGNAILDKALKAPYEQIVKNMGKTFTKQDMEEQNVYDPANVVLNAAKNAISVAAAVLTTETLVLLPRETQQAMPNIPMV